MARILVIDDEPGICRAFEKFFRKEGHEVRSSSRAETALPLAEAFGPDLVILDVRLPGMSGLEALGRLRKIDPAVPVIVVTAHGTMETAVEAVRRGAWDYVLKPLELAGMKDLVERALQSRKAAEDVVIGEAKGTEPPPVPEGAKDKYAPLIGRTPPMQEVFKKIGAASLTDAPVLLLGERGSGKEMTARAIHYSSPRADQPFEPVNCDAVPEARLHRELFAEGTGRLPRAAAGTLFLDELHAVSPGVQAELERYLEAGGPARMLAATHRDPDECGIRKELLYRLSVVTIEVPALRERAADIPLLVGRFLREGGGAITKEALRAILSYPWPGNVTELRNAIEHAAVMARGAAILPEHLPEHVVSAGGGGPAEDDEVVRALIDRALEGETDEGEVFATVMARFEKPLIAAVLEKTGGNQVKAAKLLGIHRTTLRTKIGKYGL
jgi:DNA-binding NtrC family response regulator